MGFFFYWSFSCDCLKNIFVEPWLIDLKSVTKFAFNQQKKHHPKSKHQKKPSNSIKRDLGKKKSYQNIELFWGTIDIEFDETALLRFRTNKGICQLIFAKMSF